MMQTQYYYAIHIKYEGIKELGLIVAHGRTQWKIRTARKHLKRVTEELVNGDPKWQGVRYFTLFRM